MYCCWRERAGIPTGGRHICVFPAKHIHEEQMKNSAGSWFTLWPLSEKVSMPTKESWKRLREYVGHVELRRDKAEIASNQIIR